MYKQLLTVNSVECKLFATDHPAFLLIQPSARHEEKADGLNREAALIETLGNKGFVLVAFDTVEWARSLMPWHDDAVARDEETGCHSRATLRFVENDLLPLLRSRYGDLPCIVGGYSLGALFALWAAAESSAFCAVAAASPSLWINGWTTYAQAHPMNAQRVYMSLGDREEHCRNERMKRIGDCVRRQHELLLAQLGDSNTTLEWNQGGHFGDEAVRTARAFAWCME